MGDRQGVTCSQSEPSITSTRMHVSSPPSLPEKMSSPAHLFGETPEDLIGPTAGGDQPTAFLTSASIIFSSASASRVSANSVGQTFPSSRVAVSLKPRVE
jgi:hypothetical protein